MSAARTNTIVLKKKVHYLIELKLETIKNYTSASNEYVIQKLKFQHAPHFCHLVTILTTYISTSVHNIFN